MHVQWSEKFAFSEIFYYVLEAGIWQDVVREETQKHWLFSNRAGRLSKRKVGNLES